MDRIEDVAEKTARLAASVRRVRGSGWHVSAALRTHEICLRLTSASATGASEATPTEFCGNTFHAAEAKLRQHLAANPEG